MSWGNDRVPGAVNICTQYVLADSQRPFYQPFYTSMDEEAHVSKVWGKITYRCPTFNGASLEMDQ